MEKAINTNSLTSLDKKITAFADETNNKEILLNKINPQDQIIISTQNNQYQFTLLDSLLRTGLLSGGSLGNKPCKAALLSVKTDSLYSPNNERTTSKKRILFLIEDKNVDLKNLLTSPIKALKVRYYLQNNSNKLPS